MVHPDSGIFLELTKKKWAIKPEDMEEPYMHITKWKKPVWKGYILYDSNYTMFWKIYSDIKDARGWGGGEWWTAENTEDL